jgi:hypothetical protein
MPHSTNALDRFQQHPVFIRAYSHGSERSKVSSFARGLVDAGTLSLGGVVALGVEGTGEILLPVEDVFFALLGALRCARLTFDELCPSLLLLCSL